MFLLVYARFIYAGYHFFFSRHPIEAAGGEALRAGALFDLQKIREAFKRNPRHLFSPPPLHESLSKLQRGKAFREKTELDADLAKVMMRRDRARAAKLEAEAELSCRGGADGGETLMSDDDKKLPTRVEPAGLPAAPQSGSWFGWVGSAFSSILTTKTFQKKKEAAEAYREYLDESARIPQAMLEADRAAYHYLENRGKILKNDRENHQRKIEKEEVQREIDAEEDLHKLQMIRLKHQEQALVAQRKTARAQLFLDTFTVTAPHQKDSEESKSLKGAAHAKLDMLAVLQAFLEDEETDDAQGSSRALTPEQQLALIEKMIDECLSTSTPEQMQLLYVKRAQLKNQIEEEKDRSG